MCRQHAGQLMANLWYAIVGTHARQLKCGEPRYAANISTCITYNQRIPGA